MPLLDDTDREILSILRADARTQEAAQGFLQAATAAAHAAGVAAGGTTCEDPPGWRGDHGAGGMYLAYLRDPDGNKLCVLHRPAA
jgi:catechol 2,3-dioxygenase-like lactoylglutathione lyase family enzyme